MAVEARYMPGGSGSPGNILAAHWPAGHPPALISCSEGLVISNEFSVCSREVGVWVGAGEGCDDISPLQGPGVDWDQGGVRGLPTVTRVSASSSSSLLDNLGGPQRLCEGPPWA